MSGKRVYDCDTSPYWCSEEDYNNREKTFGKFIDGGRGYRVDDPNTPRPWLNYLSNKKFGSVISNRGLGFSWFASTLLRITKYEHPIDYLPRDFVDGRVITVENKKTGEKLDLLADSKDIVCVHRPGRTILSATAFGVKFELTYFVPETDACEACVCEITGSDSEVDLRLTFSQVWSFAKFGIHTAEEGIPYLSVPGNGMKVESNSTSVICEVEDDALPYPKMFGLFQSPDAISAETAPLPETRPDGRTFTFHRCELAFDVNLPPNAKRELEVVSGAEISEEDFNALRTKYSKSGAAEDELRKIDALWSGRLENLSCSIPNENIQNFLNVWLKNQLHLIFNFVRSGQNGYRDSIQDAWGMTLIDPEASKKRLLEILSHQCADGTAPRQFSSFGDGIHDMRRFMDSPVWLPRTLIDLVKETGDFAILAEKVPFLDGKPATVDEHIFRALDYLYQHRGAHGICLTGDGDWNDALEGISKDGDAESVWLTIALYDAMTIMNELYAAAGMPDRAAVLAERAAEIKKIVNEVGWDGEWFIYGFTGTGKPIGSKTNKEGKIHLNSQSWAVFSGLADDDRAAAAMKSVERHLETPLGPALLGPPYVEEGAEVGRIANLEPGTFENGSVYQHAVTFHIFANLADSNSDPEKAVATFANLLPTNPDNFDCRRTSEPYCTGNYYCGPTHKRFGQNFFTWFTGNASWLIRAGFDEILGVKADFEGLRIRPKVPRDWNKFSVTRLFRGCRYDIRFERRNMAEKTILTVDGEEIDGDLVPISSNESCEVRVLFS